jgi:hypothetical protein
VDVPPVDTPPELAPPEPATTPPEPLADADGSSSLLQPATQTSTFRATQSVFFIGNSSRDLGGGRTTRETRANSQVVAVPSKAASEDQLVLSTKARRSTGLVVINELK